MRITGGFLRGQALISPKNETIRPTADKTRLAIFNILESRGLLRDIVVIDAFCGTGALGIEAISRGAERAIFIDLAGASLDLARQNAQKVGIVDRCIFLQKDMSRLDLRELDIPIASLVFLDPPYRQNLVLPSLTVLVEREWVTHGCIFVVETERDWVSAWPRGFNILVQKTYGASAVFMIESHFKKDRLF